MLLNILGWFWVVTGVLFLIKPDWCRGRLQKKSTRKLRWWFFSLTLFLGVLLIKATWGVPGILAKILLVLGFIGIFKAVFFLKGKAAEALISWFVAQPLSFFRVWAVSQIIFGIILLKT